MTDVARVFLSYSTKDKHLAAKIKSLISPRGYSVFLAHEDLRPSEEWISKIRRELRSCAVYLALLTDNFRKSEWTDQEAGYALSRAKLKTNPCVILPVSVHPIVAPHGFLGAFQALRLDPDDIGGACDSIVLELDERLGLKAERMEEQIDRFVQAPSYQAAKLRFNELRRVEPFSAEQMNRIIAGALENDQIQLPELFRPMKEFVSRSSISKTQKQTFIEKFRNLTTWS